MSLVCWLRDPIKGIKSVMVLAALLLLPISVVNAEEAILDFKSDITVNRDGSLTVVEKITVNAEGRHIKRGIYRDLPTVYKHPKYGEYGFKSKAPIEILGVQRNDQAEPFHIQELSNGLRVFFGSKQRFLKDGEHIYTLRYRAERQLAVNNDIAQLYWNVTGNGWRFPIKRASAHVAFPGSPYIHQMDVYTGHQGSVESYGEFVVSENSDLKVKVDEQLEAGQGMTIRVRFDSNEIVLPQESEFAKLYRDNKLWFWGVGLLILMAVVFVVCWLRSGIDPERGIVIARYRPVEGLSAAAHRAIYRNKVDDTSFSVGVLSAAIKGWLTISKPRKNRFKLTSTDKSSDGSSRTGKTERTPLSPSEKILVEGLFERRNSVTLDGEYDSRLKTLKNRYDDFLKTRFANTAHQNHTWPLLIGGVMGLAGLIMMCLVGLAGMKALATVMVVVSIALVILLGVSTQKIDGGFAYSLAFISVTMAAINVYYGNTPMAIGFAAYGILLGLFMYLMPAPKQAAVESLDKIEGFRLYLSKAEHDSLKRLDLPEKTPQLYEELLPFAIALDLETEWSEQFTDVLAAANWDSDKNYSRSSWYSGGSGSSMASFAPALATGLASSVVSASTPPSSSSSSGGGGFSGGGGGGGGGGGW